MANPTIRDGIVQAFAKDAPKFHGDSREILFCFMTDPYQDEKFSDVMGQIYPIAEAHKLKLQILTKNPDLARKDFDILAKNGWPLATTICFWDEELRREWEPGAPSIASRVAAIKDAHAAGVRTWVSVEPVPEPSEAIRVITSMGSEVDFWKIGKLNHGHGEKEIDWKKFYYDVKAAIGDRPHLIKKDLLVFA